ncbi:MAG: glycerol-3-phosphate acyltransferase [Oscillospiraceae bacterium]|nr:glycerol-3-phosphate acyltransferase [Oscillospiraceae bacterium]
MYAILSLGLGYLIGCISPAAVLSKLKNVDLKKEGTKNLGATNTAIVLGRASGIFVMLFDIFKSFAASKLAKWLFPQLAVAGMLACIGAILGHCFPVFLNFQGGKGLAAFGGMILAYKPVIFLAIVIPGVILMTLLNTGVVVPMLASVMFPVLTWFVRQSIPETVCAVVASVIIFVMHWSNLQKAIHNKDIISTKNFFKDILFKKKEK